MKLTQLFIKNYGPLNNKEYRFKPGFNLVFGFNEQGKSLTFDVLVKLLLGKSSKKFDQIDRVSDDPGQFGGFVTLEMEQDGKIITKKLQGKPNLTDLLGLTADECQNLFFVRNSDLSIGHDSTDQDNFYTNLTDRLTGLKAQEILQVKKQLREIAQLTDKTDQFQNTQENLLLGQRVDQAKRLLAPEGKIAQLINQDKQQHWSEMENQQLLLRQQLSAINQQLNQLAIARQLQEYQALSGKLKQIKQLLQRLEPFSTISQDELDNYRSYQQNLETLEETETELKLELKTKTQELKQLNQQLTTVNKKIKQLEQAQQEVENQVQPELVQFAKRSSQAKAQQQKPWQIGSLISSGLMVVGLLVYLLQPSTLISILLGIFFITTFGSSLKYFLHIQQQNKLDTQLEQIKLELAKFGINGQNVEEIVKKVQDFRQEFQQITQEQSSLTVKKDQLEDDITQLKDNKLASIKEKKSQTLQKIDQVKNICQLETLAELRKKLTEKQDLNTELQKLTVLVGEKLGKAEANSQGLRFWQTQLEEKRPIFFEDQSIKNHSPSQNKPTTQLKYDLKLEQKLVNNQEKTQERLDQLTQKLLGFKTELQELQREFNQALKDRHESIICETMTDLIQIKTELQEFINHHQQERSQVLTVIGLLEKIEQKEKAKVTQLFGKDSVISQDFAEITNHKYDQVVFDQLSSQVKVRLAHDQQYYSADKLSAGSYDQLYFTIRVGLGQKLLGKEQGFFLLDDPFLKSDQKRLKKQLDMLINLVKRGWQVVYFSAKDEVRDYLEDKVEQMIQVSLDS